MYTNTLEVKTDLRVRRTRKLLWNALKTLLETRSFDSLSVQEICDEAMVHRTTFYKHFQDKHALLSFGIEEVKELFNGRSYEDRIRQAMRLIEETKQVGNLHMLLNTEQGNSSLNCILQQHASDSLRQQLIEAEQNGVRFPVPIDIMAAFISGAICSLGAWWVNQDNPFTAQDMDAYLSQLINPKTFFPE
ncbi:TetR/AcrR family transcriptional regulator [Paenibacillus hodogayensis]|uniref:TetR/AcrR family transcriptional regulator n=1 Tax=Paenibacillus hodogayensis TaxID=279208 RepID=A0ABV5W2Z8_9BACL